MAGVTRWLAILGVLCLLGGIPAMADEPPAPPSTPNTPTTLNADAARLLELGKMCMGQNNPRYATRPVKLESEARNNAGAQALRTFQTLVKLYPQYAEGWLWLGIAHTERLHYTKNPNTVQPDLNDEAIKAGIDAFKNAYQRAPADLDCVTYYGEALMSYRRDFDGARKIWNTYLQMATTDLERVTALIQCARASLNKAYFGKNDKMSPDEVKKYYQDAEQSVALAAKLCPKAQAVIQMQALLQQFRKELYGNDTSK